MKKYFFVIIIWIFVVLLFCATALTMILSASGYKMNWTTLKVYKTGLVIVKAQPKDAQVFVNGDLVAKSMPVRVDDMLPGIYDIKVTLADYSSWSKTVKVESGMAIELNNIVLFLDNPIIETINDKEKDELANLKEDLQLLIDGSELSLLDNGIPALVTRLSQPILSAKMYPDGKHVAYQVGKEVKISDLDGQQVQTIISLQKDSPAVINFSEEGRVLLIKQEDQYIKATIR